MMGELSLSCGGRRYGGKLRIGLDARRFVCALLQRSEVSPGAASRRWLARNLLQRALQIDPDPQADAIGLRGADLNVKVFAGLVKSGADA